MTRDELETGKKLMQTIDKYQQMFAKIMEWNGKAPLRLQCTDLTIAIDGDDCGLFTEILRSRIVELENEFEEL